MSDQPSAEATPAVADAPALAATTDETPAVESPKVVEYSKFKDVQNEAKNLRQRLKEAEARLGEYETAQLTEHEKLVKQLEAAQAERETLLTKVRRSTARALAADARLVDAQAVTDLLLLKHGDALDSDDPKDHETALATLLKEYPGLARTATGSYDGARTSSSSEPATIGMGPARLRYAYEQRTNRRR